MNMDPHKKKPTQVVTSFSAATQADSIPTYNARVHSGLHHVPTTTFVTLSNRENNTPHGRGHITGYVEHFCSFYVDITGYNP